MKNRIYKLIRTACLFLLFAIVSSGVVAKQNLSASSNFMEQSGLTKKVFGKVIDSYGRPLKFEKLYIPELHIEILTEDNGSFTVEAPLELTEIQIQCAGFQSQKITIEEDLVITLASDVHKKDEFIPVSLMRNEKRSEITGSFSTIKGEELEKYPSGGFTGALTGKLSGLTVLQGGGQPNGDGAGLFIRGRNTLSGNSPIFVVDGIVSPTLDLNMMDPKTIESITVLKDAAACALYGFQGASGVILITTKRGVIGKPKVSYSSDFSIQQPTRKPKMLHSWEYASLRNQALINDGLTPEFRESEILAYENGINRELYPDNNWYKEYLKSSAFMHRHNVNITGGSERVKYFVNAGYTDQQSLFKIDGTSNSDPSQYMRRFNERMNLDIKLLPNLDAFLNQMVIVKRNNSHPHGTGTILDGIYKLPATENGPLTPDGNIIVSPWNPNSVYGMLNRTGYQRYTETNINVALGLRWGLDFITKGLELKGVVGYESRHQSGIFGSQDYARYIKDVNNPYELSFIPYGGWTDTALALNKGSNYRYFLNFNGFLNYSRTFNKKHSVEGFLNFFAQNIIREGGGVQLLPYDYLSFNLHGKYGYDNRYFIQLDGSWMSSDQFKRSNKFGFFPTISGSWVASNEAFVKENVGDWLSYLQVRASYGKLGNDNIPGGRYMYEDDIRQGRGGYIQSLYSGALITEALLGNPYLKWEDSRQQNYGISLGLFNELTLNFDYYIHRSRDILIKDYRLPSLQGVPYGRMAYENAGKVHNKGFELELLYDKEINKDLKINLGSSISFNRNKVVDAYEVDRGDSNFYTPYRQTGYAIGQHFGYLIDTSNGNGYFNSEKEIEESNLLYEGVAPRVGDFKYKDLNGDGIINNQDYVPIKYNTLPEISYSFNLGSTYKGFDFYAHMQGIAHSSRMYNGMGVFEFFGKGTFFSHHKNAWTEERFNNGDKISYPALSTKQSSSTQANSFFIKSQDYFRLKNVELGYTLPVSISKKIHTEKIRFYINGTNLLTFGGNKFKGLDPESSSLSSYPHYRTYNLGLNIVF